jgi:hypothetical protein
MQGKKLEEIIKELPEDLRKELEDFAEFFVGKEIYAKPQTKEITFNLGRWS